MPPIRLLHLSDLHFGDYNRFAGEDPAELAEALVRALSETQLEAELEAQPVDLVVVTGDVAERGLKKELEDFRGSIAVIYLTYCQVDDKAGPERWPRFQNRHPGSCAGSSTSDRKSGSRLTGTLSRAEGSPHRAKWRRPTPRAGFSRRRPPVGAKRSPGASLETSAPSHALRSREQSGGSLS